MTRQPSTREPRTPVRMRITGGIVDSFAPGTDWHVVAITSQYEPGGIIGEVPPEFTIIDLSPIEAEAAAPAGSGREIWESLETEAPDEMDTVQGREAWSAGYRWAIDDGIAALSAHSAPAGSGLMCEGSCGDLSWTVKEYGYPTHKHACRRRTRCQSHPDGCPEAAAPAGLDVEGTICLDCPAWRWDEQPDGVYGKARHSDGTWMHDDPHPWREGYIVARLLRGQT